MGGKPRTDRKAPGLPEPEQPRADTGSKGRDRRPTLKVDPDIHYRINLLASKRKESVGKTVRYLFSLAPEAASIERFIAEG